MKRFLVAFCLSIATAFAGSYDIEEFTATDAGTPDEYITAEFGGQLKTAPADEVSSLQDGRLVVRQKFTDPFGETPTAYQLYQGGKGDLSGLVALTAEGVDYSKLVTTRIYARRGMPIEEDVEKVYFDGKAVYVPGLSSAIAFVDGSMVQLKGDESAAPAEEEAPAPEVASSEEEECDEYDPDCEDEEEDEDIDVKGDLDESNSRADERDYAISDASENATDRFGIADEVRFWTAVGLSALAVTGAVVGVMQQMEANKAKDAYDDLDEVHSGIMAGITSACAADKEPAACEVAMKQYATYNTTEKYTLADLEARMDTNKKTQDSYTFARNLWFGVTAVSLTAAIVLFVW
ncbi:hypothetical protein SAMN05720781_2799 [Fibrobacter sp. UWT3]|jgi:hypothetical protein|uniref:hypothetical protein n=1 Tax=Fibrobacter sp. UWT3 TaxID=1896225 RepID=UPI000BD42B21|nr:hypothetical protein [Fibrobacter sp. UWT3]SOE78955.1 hypothetical protein SAMN05720781_2799 [Fibrobacter sp. UWT3]